MPSRRLWVATAEGARERLGDFDIRQAALHESFEPLVLLGSPALPTHQLLRLKNDSRLARRTARS